MERLLEPQYKWGGTHSMILDFRFKYFSLRQIGLVLMDDRRRRGGVFVGSAFFSVMICRPLERRPK